MPGGSGINLKIARELTDFPHPDSPTIPRVCPFFNCHDKSFTAFTVLPLILNSTRKFLTSSAISFMTLQPVLMDQEHHWVYF